MLGAFSRLQLEDEVEYMDTSESNTPWYWFYKATCGVWHKVEDDPNNFLSSNDLERYYLRNSEGVLNLSMAGGEIRIDFAAKTQVNLKTKELRQIKRLDHPRDSFRCKCDDHPPSLPEYWDNVDPRNPYQLITLKRHSREHQEVERFVRDVGLLQDPILFIHRIQNMDLWELFHRKKQQLMRIKGQSDIEEQRLFHGTRAKNVKSICKFNFKCRLSDKKRNGHVLGKGTYFAKHASLATRYSEKTRQGIKVMLIARVIVGKYKLGRQDYCTPDDDQGKNVYEHDSCVDDTDCPKIFVVFDSNQIYPEYVLEYR